MRTIIILGVMAVVLFGAAWAVSSYLANSLDEKNKAHNEASANGGDTGKEKELPPLARGNDNASRSRSGSSADTEQLVQELAKLRERQEGVSRQEQQLTARRRALEIIKEDIRAEREEIDRVRQEVSEQLKGTGDEMAAVERRTIELEKKKLETEELIKDAKRGIYDIDATRAGGSKKVGGIFDTAEPSDAASMFERMVESGDLTTAAQILSNMKDRRAAAVLSAFQDKATAAQLAEKMVGLKQASAAGAANPPGIRTPRVAADADGIR